MLRLRPYKNCDAKTIISWCKDEVSFRKWTADRYETFPITEKDMKKNMWRAVEYIRVRIEKRKVL